MIARGRQYPIRAAARLAGLGVDTLRAWERRYRAVTPGRAERGRTYTDADVSRLIRLATLVKRGHAIGTIAALDDAGLDGLLQAEATHRSAPPLDAAFDLAPLMRAVSDYDLDALEGLLGRFAAVLPPADLVFGVVVPFLREIGTLWERGDLRPAQEHLASSSVRSVVGGLMRASLPRQAERRMVLATPSGERHELGLLCAGLLAASEGVGVLYLGPDLPAGDILHAARTSGARMVLVALTTPGRVSDAELKAFAKLPPKIELCAGGPEAETLVRATGGRARVVASLADVVPVLLKHGH